MNELKVIYRPFPVSLKFITQSYVFYETSFDVNIGFISTKSNNTLYKLVLDVDYQQTLIQKILGIATIFIKTQEGRVTLHDMRDFENIVVFLREHMHNRRVLDVM